jgi:hypothetical protein
MNNIYAFGSTFAFFAKAKANHTTVKEPNQSAKTDT